MSSKNSQDIIQRKAEGLQRLSQAYHLALKSGTARKVVSLGRK